MAKAKKVKQLSFTMPNRAGLLSEVSAAVSDAKVNIDTIYAYEMGDKAYFILTTDGNARAKKALTQLGVEANEEDIVAVEIPNKIGELQKVAKKIADAGININYVYGTTVTGKSSICVLQTSDNAKASKVINK